MAKQLILMSGNFLDQEMVRMFGTSNGKRNRKPDLRVHSDVPKAARQARVALPYCRQNPGAFPCAVGTN